MMRSMRRMWWQVLVSAIFLPMAIFLFTTHRFAGLQVVLAWMAGGACLLIGLGVWLFYHHEEYVAEDAWREGPRTEHEREQAYEKHRTDQGERIATAPHVRMRPAHYFGRYKGPKD